jgi:hypothetical protein
MRFRLAAVSAVACLLGALACAGQAMAAAEVHRFNLVLSGNPTQVNGGDFNEMLKYFNTNIIDPQGYEPLSPVQFTWAYDAELRYFARPNFAITLGITQLRANESKEYLPAISQGIDVRAEILTVPVHIGAMYYLQAYNQGDFQARAYIGGGLLQYTYSHAVFQQMMTNPDTSLTRKWTAPGHPEYGANYMTRLTQDAPGYYVEAGAHMFFAARYSVILGGIYRSGQLSGMRLDRLEVAGLEVPGQNPNAVVSNTKGQPYQLDVGGLGVKLAVAIGF